MADSTARITRSAKSRRLELDRRTFLGALAVVAVVALVAALYLMLVSRTAAQGRHIQWLQSELSRLRRENEQLEVDVARESSVNRLMERAELLGFEYPSLDEVDFLP